MNRSKPPEEWKKEVKDYTAKQVEQLTSSPLFKQHKQQTTKKFDHQDNDSDVETYVEKYVDALPNERDGVLRTIFSCFLQVFSIINRVVSFIELLAAYFFVALMLIVGISIIINGLYMADDEPSERASTSSNSTTTLSFLRPPESPQFKRFKSYSIVPIDYGFWKGYQAIEDHVRNSSFVNLTQSLFDVSKTKYLIGGKNYFNESSPFKVESVDENNNWRNITVRLCTHLDQAAVYKRYKEFQFGDTKIDLPFDNDPCGKIVFSENLTRAENENRNISISVNLIVIDIQL